MVAQSSTGAIGRGIRTTAGVLDQLAPGGSIEWTVIGSGLGGIADLRLLYSLGDGQRLDTVFRPQVVIRQGVTTLFAGELLGWSGARGAETATTEINFDLAPTLRAVGLPGGLSDGMTVAVTFHSRILSLYAARVPPPLGRLLGQGDVVRNSARFSGTVAGTIANSDPTTAEMTMPASTLVASIYAVDGVPAGNTPHAGFGAIVTYRLRLQLPLASAHRVQLVATAPGLTGPFVFDSAPGSALASGHAQFGPGSSYTASIPVVTMATDAAGRPALRFDFGDIQPGNGPGTIDLLVSAPLPLGSPLVFSAAATEANAFAVATVVDAPVVTLSLNEPALRIQTATVYASNDDATWTGTGGPFGYSPDFGQFGGIVSSAGLDAEPFADRLSGLDAGDDVTFVIAVQNVVAGAAAYGVTLHAALPNGFVVPAGGASLSVTDGAGTPLAYSGDLFAAAGGLVLDPAAALAGYDPDSGRNVLLITYTLTTRDDLDLGTISHLSAAQITAYATQPGWANRAPLTPAADLTATTEVATRLPSVAIVLSATDDPSTASTLLAPGETATFQITATLPEGLSRGLDLAPLLPAGLVAVSARVLTIGANLTGQTPASDGTGGIAFGDTLNTPDDQHTPGDDVRIEVTVRSNGTAAILQPLAVQGVASVGRPGPVVAASAPVFVVAAEPVAPGVTVSLVAGLTNGAIATYRIAVALPTGRSPAFRIIDTLPPGLAYLTGSARIVDAGGVVSDGVAALRPPVEQQNGARLTLDFGAIAALAGQPVVIEFQARLAGSAVGSTLVNAVVVETGYATTRAELARAVGNTKPQLGGVAAVIAARDDTVLHPLAGIVVTDPDGQQMTLNVTVGNPAHGTLETSGGRYDALTGRFSVTGSAAIVTAAATALRFVPALRQGVVGQTVTTGLTVDVRDSAGATSSALVTQIAAAVTNTLPVIRNAALMPPVAAGHATRLFAGLMLADADVGQTGTLTIQLADPSLGMLTGGGSGRYDPVAGLFTATGTTAALATEAGRLLFTAATRPRTLKTAVTITLDDGAGGVARTTDTILVTAETLGSRLIGEVSLPGLTFAGPIAREVTVAPSSASVLTGTAGRDAYFVDGTVDGPQWATVTEFGGGDSIVLWGFKAGLSSFRWSDESASGHPGRTLRTENAGFGGGATSLTFAGRFASETDRFAISTGRVNGLDYLSIISG